MKPIISIENISKAYRIGTKEEISDSLISALLGWVKSPIKNYHSLRRLDTFNMSDEADDIIWALRDVSFDVQKGEVVGIIGRNGAGKSTLLKILSRITEPTNGKMILRGRVSSLLEVGTGFHPDLTGRENIYMNGTILGMKKKEIDKKFDEIVDFSGVEKFLDTPIKRYSSGMKVRLAFSVAAHLEPDILIIDEVLAVGDIDFQKKCLGKMQEVSSERGKTVLFVSHNMGAIQNLCHRCAALRNGILIDDGPSDKVIRKYLSKMVQKRKDIFTLDNPDRKNTGIFRLTDVFLIDNYDNDTSNVIAGEDVSIFFKYESNVDLDNVVLMFTIFNESGVAVTHINSDLKGFKIRSTKLKGTIKCFIPRCPLSVGDYRLAVAIVSNGVQLDLIGGALFFSVTDSIYFGTAKVPNKQYCIAYVDHDWELDADSDGNVAADQLEPVTKQTEQKDLDNPSTTKEKTKNC